MQAQRQTKMVSPQYYRKKLIRIKQACQCYKGATSHLQKKSPTTNSYLEQFKLTWPSKWPLIHLL